MNMTKNDLKAIIKSMWGEPTLAIRHRGAITANIISKEGHFDEH
jgi:hypothetical protein